MDRGRISNENIQGLDKSDIPLNIVEEFVMGRTNIEDIRIEEIKNKLESLLGNEKVLDDDYILASYTMDGTVLYYPLSRPSLVALPHTTEEVQKVVQIANEYKIPVVASGGRTNSWGAIDSNHGIAIDMFNMNNVIE